MNKNILIFVCSLLALVYLSDTVCGQDNDTLIKSDTITKFTTYQTIKFKNLTFDTIVFHTNPICKFKTESDFWVWKKPDKTPLERTIVTEGCVVGYSIIDYIGYNLCKNGNVELYRSFQGALFASIVYFLHDRYGWSSASSFSIQVFSAVPDGIYYGIDGLSKGFGGFSNGNEWSHTKYYNQLNFSWMYHIAGGKNRLEKSGVAAQILIGLSIGLVINL